MEQRHKEYPDFYAIPGYEGFYISRNGIVLGKRDNPLNQYIDEDGYSRVCISTKEQGRKRKPRGIHQLICLTFHGPRPAGKMACHRDGMRDINDVDNIYWGTAQDNADDCTRHGNRRGAHPGEDHHLAKLTEKEARKVSLMRDRGMTHLSIAKRLGVSRTTISFILSGKRWRSLNVSA